MIFDMEDQPLPGMEEDPYNWGLTDEQVDALFEGFLTHCDGCGGGH